MSPTQRSLRLLRDGGWLVAIVEHWNPFARIRQDLFGFADLLAIRGNVTLAVQTTSGSNLAARVKKIRACQAAHLWMDSRSRQIVVHAWIKAGRRGKRKHWTCREVGVQLDSRVLPPPLANRVTM